MSTSLLFDEATYEKLPEVKKPVYVFDWLCSLEKRLLVENKQVIKECQEDLVQQLLSHLTHAPGRPTHKLLGRCFANLFLVGDSLLLYTAVNTCNGLLKCRDDGPTSINSRLAALSCLGAIYKRLGRMIGRSFEDSVIIMVKLIKQSESQVRCETMNTICNLIEGVGSASAVCHKEIYKAAKICMTDRVLYVRVAAAKCLYFLVDHSNSIHTSELEATVSLCLRCLDGANYATRIEASRTLGHLLAKTQRKKGIDQGSDANSGGPVGTSGNSRGKTVTLSDALSLLSSGFLKGPGGFLKATSATDMIKGTSPVNREVRVGVTYAYIEFIVEMGPQWFESNLSTILTHIVNLLLIPRATPTHVEAICARKCIQYLLGTVFRHLLSESIQLVAANEIIKILTYHLQSLQNLHTNEYSINNSSDVFQQIFSSSISSSSSTLTAIGGNYTSSNNSSSSNNNNTMNESPNAVMNDIFNETLSGNNSFDEVNGDNQITPTTYNLDNITEIDNGNIIKKAFGRQISMTTITTATPTPTPSAPPTSSGGNSSSRSNREQQHQHLVICLLDIINQLIRWLDSLVVQLLDQPTQLVDVLCTCLMHPIQAVRLAAASCLRQLVIVLPSQRIPLLNRFLSYLQQSHRYNADTLLGVTFGITGLLAGVNYSILGLSNNIPKQMFSLAEDLLREANQNSRFTLARTQSGWNLLAACITLGPNIVKPHLARIFLFWRNAFPRSLRELEAEKQRGDAFTWQVMLESRSGALCSMQSFLEYCSPYLLTEDIIHRLLPLIECGLNMLSQMNDIVRIYGNHLKLTAGFIRLRLYRILLLLPPTAYTTFVHHLWQTSPNQQGSYSTILRELVAEFTLTDNMANTTTSLFKSLCRSEDSVTLSSCSQDTDQRLLEEQLQPAILNNAPGSLEHDPAYLYLRDGVANVLNTDVTLINLTNGDENGENIALTAGTLFHGPSNVFSTSGIFSTTKFYNTNSTSSNNNNHNNNNNTILLLGNNNPNNFSNVTLSCELIQITGPMPINIAVIDASIELFGKLFACVSLRHCTQMLEHFTECIRLTKSIRQEAVQINVFAALLNALRYLTEIKSSFGDDLTLRKAATNLIFSRLYGYPYSQNSTLINELQRSIIYDATLTSPSVLLRCVAGECLGRLVQVVGESNFLAELAQQIFERLRTVRNPIARAGHCLAIGCLHRYVGGLASGQHLSSSVGVLLAIAQDSSVPEVQVWALHALALVADSGGPIFRQYVEPSLSLVLQLLLKAPSAMHEIQRGLGRLFAALITTLGPELRGTSTSIASIRHSCLLCCMIMRDSSDSLLQAEGIACLQQLHMFAPMHVKLAGLVPELQANLTSFDLVLRRAALSCLRQLSQKETMDLYGFVTQSDETITPILTSLSTLSNNANNNNNNNNNNSRHGHFSTSTFTTKLESQLFSLLNVEMDYQLRRDIEDTLIGMLHATGTLHLTHWFSILKEVLQVSTALKTDMISNDNSNSNNAAIVTTNFGQKSLDLNSNGYPSRISGVDSLNNPGQSGNIAETSGVDTEYAEEDEDVDVNFKPKQSSQEINQLFSVKINARCSTRIFAINCLRVLISTCAKLCNNSALINANDNNTEEDMIINSNSLAHFDLAKARILHCQTGKSDWLILYLSDLIRIAFMSATSESDRLRITGLKLMQDVVQRFSSVPDPDFPDHVILEQYQAQVSAALRPAFMYTSSSDLYESGMIIEPSTGNISTSSIIFQPNPELMNIACQVCSKWITSGVGRDPEDLRRVQDLLKQAFNKLKLNTTNENHSSDTSISIQRTESSQWISENSKIVERLSILAAWAEIYIVTTEQAIKWGSKLNRKQQFESSQSQRLDDEQPIDESDDMINNTQTDEEFDYSTLIKGISLEDLLSTDFKSDQLHLGSLTKRKTTTNKPIQRLLVKWIQPILPSLSQAWLDALKDYACMNLPENLSSQQVVDTKNSTTSSNVNNNNTNYNLDQIRVYYARYWPCMTYALSLWLSTSEVTATPTTIAASSFTDEDKVNTNVKGSMLSKSARQFFLILGMCVEAMCNTTSKQPISIIHTCLRCILCLLSRSKFRAYLMQSSTEISIELLLVIHRLLLTRECIETHLLCLANVIHILIAANERLTKERDDWLTKESSQNDVINNLLISPELKTSRKNCMTSSIMLQTTGLIDAQMYEHGEGGYLARFFDSHTTDHDEQDNNNNNNIKDNNNTALDSQINLCNKYGKIFAGLHPERSIVFTCLEIVVCIVARYRPQVIKHLRILNTDNTEDKNHNIIPETVCASNFNAPCVLAAALKCLLPLIDLCAPKTLLSTLRLGKQNQNMQSNRYIHEESQANSQQTSPSYQYECLLPILLDLASEIAKDVLLKQYSNEFQVNRSNEGNRNLGIFKSYNLSLSQSSNSFTSYLIDDDETEISSTTTNLSVCINDIEQRYQRRHRYHCYISDIIGWNEELFQLAEVYITLMNKLTTHHYPTLSIVKVETNATGSSHHQDISITTNSSTILSSQTTEIQPDSSSIINKEEEISNSNNNNNNDIHSLSMNTGKHNNSVVNAYNEWYNLISRNMLSILLQHEHYNDIEVDTHSLRKCCLISAYLVSRICKSCPLQIFQSSDLVNTLSSLLCHGWCLSQFQQNSQTNTEMNENVNSIEYNIFSLLNSKILQNRIICLGAFESLCSHHEPSISALFIKILTPQVFRWLYDLTNIVELYSSRQQHKLDISSCDTLNNQINLNEFIFCLNASFDLLTSIISKAESSNRQALLLIYLPLLCNLLSNDSYIIMNRSYSTNHYTILLPMNLSELIYYMHTTTLKHVITIAPYFPNEIRSTFHILSDLKLRLENAIKLSNPLINTTTTANDSNSNSNLYDQSQSRFQLKGISSNRYPVKQSEISLPSIKLKTDFSNFTYN